MVEEVITRYPCRAIVVRGVDDGERKITAEVSALCHLPDPGMPQVCSERIVLRAGPDAVGLIPGAVRPLLEADLPMVLWWTTDPRSHEALFRDLGDECSRLLLDLPDPGTPAAALRLGLDPAICPCSRDTVWFGLTRWRELVAQFFDPPCHHETLNRVDSLQIEALSPDPSVPPRLAIWLAAWLAGQLGWKPQGRPVNQVTSSGSSFRAAFLGPLGTLAVEIVTQPITAHLPATPLITGVAITARGPEGVETFCLQPPHTRLARTSGSRRRPRTTAASPAWSGPPSWKPPAASPPHSTRRGSTGRSRTRVRSPSGCSSMPSRERRSKPLLGSFCLRRVQAIVVQGAFRSRHGKRCVSA